MPRGSGEVGFHQAADLTGGQKEPAVNGENAASSVTTEAGGVLIPGKSVLTDEWLFVLQPEREALLAQRGPRSSKESWQRRVPRRQLSLPLRRGRPGPPYRSGSNKAKCCLCQTVALGDVSLTGNQPLPGALELEHRRLPKTARGAPSTSSAVQAFFSFHRLDFVLQVRAMMHSTRRFREEFYDPVTPKHAQARRQGRADIPAARPGNRSEKWHR